MQIDLTQIIITILSILGTIVTGFIIPSILKYLQEKNITISDKTLDLLRKLVKDAVEYAEEDYWNNPDKAIKREEAIKFVKTRLIEYNLTFDEILIEQMISSAVQAYIRKSN